MRWLTDSAIVLVLLGLAAYLYSEAPRHPTIRLREDASFVAAVRLPHLRRGSGANLALQVKDLAGPKWRADDVTLSPNAGIAPDGTNTAYRMTESNTTGLHRIETKLTGASAAYFNVLSVFVRAEQRSALRFEMRDATGGKYGLVHFDLAHGAVVGAAGDVSDAGMHELPGGWYRCWAAMPLATEAIVFNFALVDGRGEGTYAGDGRSGLLIWGVQFEPGDDVARGYNDGSTPPTH